MLAVTSYSADHVATARDCIDRQLDAYDAIRTTPEFDDLFFPNLLLALDRWFVHRMRGAEGKDGNPLNELRMICDSVVNNGGMLTADKSIRYRPEASVTGLSIGDRIDLDRSTARALADGVLTEIERRYPPA